MFPDGVVLYQVQLRPFENKLYGSGAEYPRIAPITPPATDAISLSVNSRTRVDEFIVI